MIDVVMPQMGESIVEGTLTKWLKKAGERVERDEPLFEISTDKVDSEIPSPAAGVLADVLVEEGKTVAINTMLPLLRLRLPPKRKKRSPHPHLKLLLPRRLPLRLLLLSLHRHRPLRKLRRPRRLPPTRFPVPYPRWCAAWLASTASTCRR